MKTILALMAMIFVLAAATAQAQASDASVDAMVPDATVGMGGADMNSEENEDGTAGTSCMRGGDCATGFDCVQNVCTYNGTRNATCAGCGPGLEPIAMLLMLGVVRSMSKK